MNNEKDKNNLPEKWEISNLGEICSDPQYGWTTKASTKGDLFFLRTTDITSGRINWDQVPFCDIEPNEKEKYILHHGDIVISRAGSVGFSYLIKNPPKAIFASYLIRFKPKIDEKYVAFYLKSSSYWETIVEKKIGIAIPNVNASKLKQIRIPIPPKNEQCRIVEKIEELFTKLDAGMVTLEKVRAQLKRYRQAVLKAAFSGELTAEWRQKHSNVGAGSSRPLVASPTSETDEGANTAPLPNADIPDLPAGWEWTSITKLGEINRGKSKHRPRDDVKLFGGKYPFIQTGDVKNSKGLITKYSQTYNDFGLQQSQLWPVNTLCITIAANIADTAILGIEACFPDSVVGFIANEEKCLIKFIHYYFKTIKDRLESFAPATAQKNINLAILKNISVPLPTIEEQHQIVSEIERRFSVADEVEKTVENALKQAKRLRQSILKMAFEGRLVPQDPNDEPAEKLLARIKKQKEEMAQVKKQKGRKNDLQS